MMRITRLEFKTPRNVRREAALGTWQGHNDLLNTHIRESGIHVFGPHLR